MSDRKQGNMGGGPSLLFFNYSSTSAKQSSTPLGLSFWEESKDLGSLWAGSELLRMVGLEISSQGASPLGLAAGAVTLDERSDS